MQITPPWVLAIESSAFQVLGGLVAWGKNEHPRRVSREEHKGDQVMGVRDLCSQADACLRT